MTDLDFLRGRIGQYAGYANDDARHQVDKQMRGWLGEALAAARDRLVPSGPLAERLDGLLLRCEFSDQRLVRAIDHARFDEALSDRLHALDRQIVECAGRIRAAADAAALTTELDCAARSLDERYGAIADAPSA